jgi:hypothetical protein
VRCVLCELVGFAQGFWKAKPLAAFQNELIARQEIDAMSG